MKIKLIVIICASFQLTAISQKIEKESRVSKETIPAKALDFINDIDINNKIKWYKEETSGRDSYESKFKFRNSFYSVEFDTLGNVEDIEVLQKRRDLTEQQLTRLSEGILAEFEKFKWIKIQIQYVGKPNDLKKLFVDSETSIPYNFEVEIEAKMIDSSWKTYELLLSPEGNILMKREIHLRPTDNLNY